jgi:branched-chain amino acid transport system permease protein
MGSGLAASGRTASGKAVALLYGVLLLAGLVAPHFIYPTFLMKLLCFALFASAFNLLIGFAGLLSFGHAAFLGIAGYTCGLLMRDLGWAPEWGLLAGTASAALLGWLFGSLAIRRTGIYFSMITLALSQMLYFVVLQVKATGGEDGLQGVPRGRLFGWLDLSDSLNLYYVVLAVFVLGFCIIHRAIHSPFGQILKAIRENEPRAISLGYDVSRFKLIAFTLSAALAGLAGATKTLVFQLASLSDVHWHMSGEVVLMTLLGGLGTILGPAVGAAVVVTLQNELASRVGSWVTVIMGGIFVVCVLLFRRGIVGELAAFLNKRSGSVK